MIAESSNKFSLKVGTCCQQFNGEIATGLVYCSMPKIPLLECGCLAGIKAPESPPLFMAWGLLSMAASENRLAMLRTG